MRVDKVSDLMGVTEETHLKKGFGLPLGVGSAQRGDLYVQLEPQWDAAPSSVWEHFLQVSEVRWGPSSPCCSPTLLLALLL